MKLAILSNVSTQYLSQNISQCLNDDIVGFEIYEAPFATWQIASRGFDSELQIFNPDSILLFLSSAAAGPVQLNSSEFMEQIKEAIDSIKTWFKGKLYVSSLDYSDVALVSIDIKMSIDKINIKLFELSKSNEFIFIDLFSIIHTEEYESFSPGKYYGIGGFSFHPKFYGQIGKRIAGVIQAAIQRPIKIIFVDLDNTLWPGILGDEGIEAINLAPDTAASPHLSLQFLLKSLHHNGVLLAICSKNNLESVESFFKVRDNEMVLKWADFSAVKANWEPKSKNIADILIELNLTAFGAIFIDDSAFERNEIKTVFPEINVLELPEEPYAWSKFFSETELFHTPIVTKEDIDRTHFYQSERKRLDTKKSMTQADYLSSLKLQLTGQVINHTNLDRVVQLINKTNQFNTNGIRVDYEKITNYASSPECFAWAFSLEDLYSNYGIISCIYGKVNQESQIHIDGWVLSCRAFTRNVETAIIQFLANELKACPEILIHFEETKKNKYAQKYFNDAKFHLTQKNDHKSKVFSKSIQEILNINTHVSIT